MLSNKETKEIHMATKAILMEISMAKDTTPILEIHMQIKEAMGKTTKDTTRIMAITLTIP